MDLRFLAINRQTKSLKLLSNVCEQKNEIYNFEKEIHRPSPMDFAFCEFSLRRRMKIQERCEAPMPPRPEVFKNIEDFSLSGFRAFSLLIIERFSQLWRGIHDYEQYDILYLLLTYLAKCASLVTTATSLHDFRDDGCFQQLELEAARSWVAPARTAGVAAQEGRPVKTMAFSPPACACASCVILFEEQC